MELGFSPETLDILREIYPEETPAVVEALKTPGQTFSLRVNTLKASRDEVLQTLEDEGWNPRPHPSLADVILLPVPGPYELSEAQCREVIVDKRAAEAILRGADLYAPGVQRCHGLRRGEKVAITAPDGGRIAFGRAVMNQTEILHTRKGLAVVVEQSKYDLPSLREHRLFKEGLIYPQTLPSALVSRNLHPIPEELIVDMNAAPGGKVTHLAQLTGNRGRILAFDRHAEKIHHISQNLHRMGITCIETRVADSRYLDKDFPTLKPDAVLVDPPCSALGIRPKIYDTTSRREVRIVADYQRQFLQVAARILKPEGRIIYSTCTMTLEECEIQVESVCESYGLNVEKQELRLGSSGFGWFHQGGDCQRFHPHLHDAPGFFIALLRKSRR